MMADPEKRLADMAEEIKGVVDNGAWVLIKDPALRELVGRHIANALAEVAATGGLTEQVAFCRDRFPGAVGVPMSLDDV